MRIRNVSIERLSRETSLTSAGLLFLVALFAPGGFDAGAVRLKNESARITSAWSGLTLSGLFFPGCEGEAA